MEPKALKPKSPTEIDCLVGSRVRQQRMKKGLSLDQLAQALGITVPQLHKYEKGTNRIGASRLHKIAGLLGAPITFFFETNSPAAEAPEPPQEPYPPVFADRMAIELAMAFSRISRPEVRRALLEMARSSATLGTVSDEDLTETDLDRRSAPVEPRAAA